MKSASSVSLRRVSKLSYRKWVSVFSKYPAASIQEVRKGWKTQVGQTRILKHGP